MDVLTFQVLKAHTRPRKSTGRDGGAAFAIVRGDAWWEIGGGDEISQTSGEQVVVPNSFLFSNPIDVLTNLPRRRVTIIAGVSYDTDVAEAVALVQKTVEG